MIEEKEPLKTNEVSNLLGVSEKTIYNYVKSGKLKPINYEQWQIEGTYYFSNEDIQKLMEDRKKPGFTTVEAAEILGISPTTVFRYVKDKKLPAIQEVYNGRSVYFINEEDLEEFNISKIQHYNRRKKEFYSKKEGIALFQLFIREGTKEEARIISLTGKEYKVMTEDGEVLSLSELTNRGYKPKYEFANQKVNTRKGYVTFEFKKRNEISSAVYRVLDLFYQYIGPVNMRIQLGENDSIKIEVKPTLLPIDKNLYFDEIEVIKHNIIEGKILYRLKGVMIDTNLEGILIHLPTALKSRIKKRATTEEKSMEEVIVDVLEKEFPSSTN